MTMIVNNCNALQNNQEQSPYFPFLQRLIPLSILQTPLQQSARERTRRRERLLSANRDAVLSARIIGSLLFVGSARRINKTSQKRNTGAVRVVLSALISMFALNIQRRSYPRPFESKCTSALLLLLMFSLSNNSSLLLFRLLLVMDGKM